MGSLVEEWLSSYSRKETRRNYRFGIRTFERFFERDPDALIEQRCKVLGKPTQLKASDNYIARFFFWAQKEGLSSGTAQLYYASVRSFCAFHGVPLGKPPRGMRSEVEYEQGTYPKQEDLARMVDAARSWRDKAFILLLAQSGVRISMACALKVKDIKGYQNGWVLNRIVWDTDQRERFSFKGGNVICFGPETAEYLKLMFEERMRQGEALTPESWVFRSNLKSVGFQGCKGVYRGKPRPLTGRNANNQIVHKAAEAAGLIDTSTRKKRYRIHAHSLRKFFFNALIGQVDDIIREYLMNHRIDRTRKAYFDNTGSGRDEILLAYRRAYPRLSVKGISPKIEEVETQLAEQRIEIMELTLKLERMDQAMKNLRQTRSSSPQPSTPAGNAVAQYDER